MKQKKTTKKIFKLRLVARTLSVPMILYALLMFIGYIISWITKGVADPYALENYPFIENLPPIFMFLAALGLGIAWFNEKLGGIINLIFCLATLPILLIHWPILKDSRYAIPYILLVMMAIPGILFTIFWLKSKNYQKEN